MYGQRIDLGEAARRLGVHYMTVYRYVRMGRLPAVQDGGRWLIDPDDLAVIRPGRADPTSRRGRAKPQAQRSRLRARLLAGDEPGAWGIIESILVAGSEPVTVLMDVIAPALRDIGDGWKSGRLSVGDEHRATAVAIRLVGRIGPLVTRRGRSRGTVVLGCVPGDSHALPAAILATVLRGEGYAVVELGGDTPADALTSAAAGAGSACRAVGLSVASSHCVPAVPGVIDVVRNAVPAVPILIGGPAVASADEAAELGADGWAPDARGAAELIATIGQGEK